MELTATIALTGDYYCISLEDYIATFELEPIISMNSGNCIHITIMKTEQRHHAEESTLTIFTDVAKQWSNDNKVSTLFEADCVHS